MISENDQNSVSFGQYLKNTRQDKKISLEAVANAIKIQAKLVEHIENEEHDKLPTAVFVKGFLRAYADFVGVDKDKTVQFYNASLYEYRKSAGIESDRLGKREATWQQVSILICAMILVIILSVFVISPQPDIIEEGRLDQVEQILNDKDILNADGNKEENALEERESQKRADTILLRIHTIEATTLKIIVDNQDPQSYNLHPGDRLEFEASSGFNILLGKTSAVRLFVNDRLFRVSDSNGQMVNIQIP